MTNSPPFISAIDLSRSEIERLLDLGEDMQTPHIGNRRALPLNDCILAATHLPPSQPTMLGFQAAMYRLGGNVLWNPLSSDDCANNPQCHWVTNIAAALFDCCDAVAISHPDASGLYRLADRLPVPLINAGGCANSGAEDPAHALAALLTIRQAIGRLDNLTVILSGATDQPPSSSFALSIARFDGIKLYYCPSTSRELPSYVQKALREADIPLLRIEQIDDVVDEADVLYHFDIAQCKSVPTSTATAALSPANSNTIILLSPTRLSAVETMNHHASNSSSPHHQLKNVLPLQMAILIDRIEPRF